MNVDSGSRNRHDRQSTKRVEVPTGLDLFSEDPVVGIAAGSDDPQPEAKVPPPRDAKRKAPFQDGA